MNALWLFFILIFFCIYIFVGLHITEGIDSLVQIILTWVIYTIMCTTFLNVFILGYFWSVIQSKKGPTGLRGPSGESGKIGIKGNCGIDATEAYLIKVLIEYIDGLYYSKTNTHIMNDNYRLPSRYINNKIGVTASSRQYKVLVANLAKDNKPIIDIINYLKSIWKKWFDLIYDATEQPGVWFTDEFSDEEYTWTGNNPFTEIRKYDVYYWGITRNFRPLKAEICRSTSLYENSKLPTPNLPREPRLKIIQSNDYYKVGDQYGSNRNQYTSWWSPNVVKYEGDTYFPIGDVMTLNTHDQYKTGKTISGDLQYDYRQTDNGPDMKTVVDPINYNFLDDVYSRQWVNTHGIQCPAGYQSLGDVAISYRWNVNSGKFNTYKCVPSECVEDVQPSYYGKNTRNPNQWNKYDRWFGFKGMSLGWHYTWYSNTNVLNSWQTGTKEALGQNGYNLMRVNGSAPFRKIKDSCLAVPPRTDKATTKDVEEQNAELGIGWNGHPYKLDPKYSIFTFLNLVPEGMIVNKGTATRYYTIHYGGEDANKYIVLYYNTISGKYDNSIQVSSNTNEDSTKILNVNRSDIRQQWQIVLQNDKTKLKLKNYFNNKYLYIGIDPKQGISQFSTINLDNNNYKNHPVFSQLNTDEIENGTIFTFISSFGTNLNIIDK